MATKAVQKRNEKAQQLKVLQSSDGNFYVESSEGKILYKVQFSEQGKECSCGDYARGAKNSPDFKCKHIIAVEESIPNGEKADFLEKKKPKLDERFIKSIKGREFVVYSGLLDLAHQRGLYKIDVHVIQYPSNDNGREAICEATVESKTGEVFCDIGDANPKNCSSEISNHILRMASTRAKARAMRDFTNIGMTCLEELTDLDEVIGQSNHDSKRSGSKMQNSKKSDNPPAKQTTKKEEPSDTEESEEKKTETKEEPKETESDPPKKSSTPKMSEAQKRAVYNLSRRRGISVEELGKMALSAYGVELEHLSSSDASSFIRQLQQSA